MAMSLSTGAIHKYWSLTYPGAVGKGDNARLTDHRCEEGFEQWQRHWQKYTAS